MNRLVTLWAFRETRPRDWDALRHRVRSHPQHKTGRSRVQQAAV